MPFGRKKRGDFNGILKRLEYSTARVYDYSRSPVNEKFEYVLKENIWDKTEFVYVLAERYGAVLIFDYDEAGMEGFAQIILCIIRKIFWIRLMLLTQILLLV